MEPKLVDAPSVQTHLQLLQGVINRMAANSANCKTWGMGIVAAVLALSIGDRRAYVAIAPVVVFAFLDVMYLAYEKLYRDKYTTFVGAVVKPEATEAPRLFDLRAPDMNGAAVMHALTSWSVWPVYAIMMVAIVIAANASAG